MEGKHFAGEVVEAVVSTTTTASMRPRELSNPPGAGGCVSTLTPR